MKGGAVRDGSTACDGPASRGGRRALRSRWWAASLAAGWPFPSDWDAEAVEEVCAAVVAGEQLADVLAGLGAARAAAGVGLRSALQDVAALHAVSADERAGPAPADPDGVPSWMVRALSVGWSEALLAQVVGGEVRDPLTGLATAGYLGGRLAEVQRAARVRGRAVSESHALVVFSLDPCSGPVRSPGMVLVGDVLGAVFCGGETAALVRPSAAAVLAPREPGLRPRCELALARIRHRFAADGSLGAAQVTAWEAEFPADPFRLLDQLAPATRPAE
ncbi:hypothetical protein IQ251_18175 [Saccharopolyspora sp. HNM0983]|uniref:Uncharacterized protein n=1 Tax=Saccharopolyspora montiporae TaxID=2781240 RepID=A0A929BAN2_9PSEU|nr:hypothetical protein [Saccharopolyspora sp. HNM0983]MBE9376382.1 hypothetical protein [Saccharopolyspora sp. HNM0983]